MHGTDLIENTFIKKKKLLGGGGDGPIKGKKKQKLCNENEKKNIIKLGYSTYGFVKEIEYRACCTCSRIIFRPSANHIRELILK